LYCSGQKFVLRGVGEFRVDNVEPDCARARCRDAFERVGHHGARPRPSPNLLQARVVNGYDDDVFGRRDASAKAEEHVDGRCCERRDEPSDRDGRGETQQKDDAGRDYL